MKNKNLYLNFVINFLIVILSISLAIVGIVVIKPIKNVLGIAMLVFGVVSFFVWLIVFLISNPKALKNEQLRAEKEKYLKRKINEERFKNH